jgi:hypothetical protein
VELKFIDLAPPKEKGPRKQNTLSRRIFIRYATYFIYKLKLLHYTTTTTNTTTTTAASKNRLRIRLSLGLMKNLTGTFK